MHSPSVLPLTERQLGDAPTLDRILVPLDGSPFAERILKIVARTCARPQETEITLLAVMQSETRTPGPVRGSCDYLEGQRRLLSRLGATVRYDVAFGDPAARILEFASSYRPALIAMATHGRGWLARLRSGSVTEEVVRHSPCPVLSWNPLTEDPSWEAGGPEPRRILVALDGTEDPGELLPLARDLARSHRASVTLLHVIQPIAIAAPMGPVVNFVAPGGAIALLAPYRHWMETAGVIARVAWTIGAAAPSVLETARAERPDLVILGTRHRSAIGRWLHGSVAAAILRECPCPVITKPLVGTLDESESEHE